ncbi:MAG: hypothetical protein R8F63_00795 [Acidimicrobiales bacterium]|nr:hypothetical protein [Acidimicrobiales bacterium]
MSERPARCPSCGDDAVIPIEYGMPGPEMQAAAERGEIALGGCVIGPENPNWRCVVCGQNG